MTLCCFLTFLRDIIRKSEKVFIRSAAIAISSTSLLAETFSSEVLVHHYIFILCPFWKLLLGCIKTIPGLTMPTVLYAQKMFIAILFSLNVFHCGFTSDVRFQLCLLPFALWYYFYFIYLYFFQARYTRSQTQSMISSPSSL